MDEGRRRRHCVTSAASSIPIYLRINHSINHNIYPAFYPSIYLYPSIYQAIPSSTYLSRVWPIIPMLWPYRHRIHTASTSTTHSTISNNQLPFMSIFQATSLHNPNKKEKVSLIFAVSAIGILSAMHPHFHQSILLFIYLVIQFFVYPFIHFSRLRFISMFHVSFSLPFSSLRLHLSIYPFIHSINASFTCF